MMVELTRQEMEEILRAREMAEREWPGDGGMAARPVHADRKIANCGLATDSACAIEPIYTRLINSSDDERHQSQKEVTSAMTCWIAATQLS